MKNLENFIKIINKTCNKISLKILNKTWKILENPEKS